MYIILCVVGLVCVKGMMLFVEFFSVGQVVDWGLIWEVVLDVEFEVWVVVCVVVLFMGLMWVYLVVCDVLMVLGNNDMVVQFEVEVWFQVELVVIEDFCEGVVVFLGKCVVVFIGCQVICVKWGCVL